MKKPCYTLAKRFCKILCKLGYDDAAYDFMPDEVNMNDIQRMLKKAQDIRSTYFEEGHANSELREGFYQVWHCHVLMLDRFISAAKREQKTVDDIMNASGWDTMTLEQHLYYWSFLDEQYDKANTPESTKLMLQNVRNFMMRCYSFCFGKAKPKAENAAKFLKDCNMFIWDKQHNQHEKSFIVSQAVEDVKAVIVLLEAGTKGVRT